VHGTRNPCLGVNEDLLDAGFGTGGSVLAQPLKHRDAEPSACDFAAVHITKVCAH